MSVSSKVGRVVQAARDGGVRGVWEVIDRRSGSHPPTVEPTYDPVLIKDVFDGLSRRTAFSVVQVGAFVGDSFNDPLFDFLNLELPTHPGSIAVLIEPVKRHFAALKRSYADVPGVVCEQVAIADRPGVREIHTIDADPVADGMPEWLEQLSSFNSDRMTVGWDRYEAKISDEARDWQAWYLAHQVTEEVECVTLMDLLDKHKISDLDLLQIDTEGYDYEIVKSIDFDKVRPSVINYERVHLRDAEVACRDLLYRAGYVLFDWGQDTLAVRWRG